MRMFERNGWCAKLLLMLMLYLSPNYRPDPDNELAQQSIASRAPLRPHAFRAKAPICSMSPLVPAPPYVPAAPPFP
jgi:hypothetical protein